MAQRIQAHPRSYPYTYTIHTELAQQLVPTSSTYPLKTSRDQLNK